MREHEEAPYRRPALMWWELLAYALMLAAAFAFNALQFPKWVVIPLVLAALGVRAVRILLERRMKGRRPGTMHVSP